MDYRTWLQQQANKHSDAETRKQAQALLHVVGNDMKVDGRFLDQQKYGGQGVQFKDNYSNYADDYSAYEVNRLINPQMQKLYGADMELLEAEAAKDTGVGTGTGAKALDLAGLASLDSLIGRYDTDRSNALSEYGLTKSANLKEKEEELERERGKFDSKNLSNTQEFGDAVTSTDMSTRDTLGGLISSLSTMGLGGGAELQRQILSAANRANRKADTTQANNARDLTQSFNEYTAGNENDVKKINDQFGYNEAQANKTYNENKQNALYRKAELYRDAGQDSQRNAIMSEADGLTSLIGNSTFLNPSYTGETKTMATPDLSSFSQDIGSYNTTGLGGATPVGGGNVSAPAVRAVPLNEQDYGVKKKTEGSLGYGV